MENKSIATANDVSNINNQLESIKLLLDNIIFQSQVLFETEGDYTAVENFIKACIRMKNLIEVYNKQETKSASSFCNELKDGSRNSSLCCKETIRGISHCMSKFTTVPDAKDAEMRENINKLKAVILEINREDSEKPVKNVKIPDDPSFDQNKHMLNTTLNKFNKLIEELKEIIHNYYNEGLLCENHTKLIDSLENINIKVKNAIKTHKTDRLRSDGNKPDNVKLLLNHNASTSDNGCLNSCNKFKQNKDPDSYYGKIDSFKTFLSRITNTVHLAEKAVHMGLLPDTTESFIHVCENVVKKLNAGDTVKQKESMQTSLLDILSYNLDDIIAYITKYKDEGMVSPSVENFLRECEDIRSKLDHYKYNKPHKTRVSTVARTALLESWIKGLSVEDNVPTPTYSLKDVLSKPLPGCSNITYEQEQVLPGLSQQGKLTYLDNKTQVCNSSEENSCRFDKEEDCLKPNSPDITNIRFLPQKPSCAHTKSKCMSSMVKSPIPCCSQTKPKSDNNRFRTKSSRHFPTSDTKIGYFEKVSKTVKSINRYKDNDGKIKEERKTVTEITRKHNPGILKMPNDESNLNMDSVMGLLRHPQVMVTCIVPMKEACTTTVRNFKSEDDVLDKPRYDAILRESTSLEPIFSKMNDEFIIKQYDFDTDSSNS